MLLPALASVYDNRFQILPKGQTAVNEIASKPRGIAPIVERSHEIVSK